MRHSVRSVIATAILTTSLSPLVARATTPPPQCVVSLSPTATETLFAIGAGSQVKAVDRDSNFPAGRLPATRIDALNPSVEAVAGVCPRRQGVTAKPDLVIVAYDTNNIVANLRALGVRVIEHDAATSVADALAQIRQLGTATGHVAAAQRLDLLRDDVTDHDVMPELGEAGTRHEPDPPCTEDPDPGHRLLLSPFPERPETPGDREHGLVRERVEKGVHHPVARVPLMKYDHVKV